MHTMIPASSPRQLGLFRGFVLGWIRYAEFWGRSSRMEFWSFLIINGVIQGLLSLFSTLLGVIFYLLYLIPVISVSVRRLHDIGRSSWWIFWEFASYAVAVISLGIYGQKSGVIPSSVKFWESVEFWELVSGSDFGNRWIPAIGDLVESPEDPVTLAIVFFAVMTTITITMCFVDGDIGTNKYGPNLNLNPASRTSPPALSAAEGNNLTNTMIPASSPRQLGPFRGFFLGWRWYAKFRGRSSRMEFWSFSIISIAIQGLLFRLSPILAVTFFLLSLIPSISVSVRRFHDIGRSAWWIFWMFVSFAVPLTIWGIFWASVVFITLFFAVIIAIVLAFILPIIGLILALPILAIALELGLALLAIQSIESLILASAPGIVMNIIIYIMCLTDGDPETNQYGPNPKLNPTNPNNPA